MTDILTTQAELQGDASAVIVDAAGGAHPSATSYGELNVMANRLGNGLLALGARPSERVVWCGANSLQVVTGLHAFRKAGLGSVPLSYRFTAEEMQYVVDNSDSTMVLVDAEQAPLLAAVRDRLPKVREIVVFGGPAPDGFVHWDDVVGGAADTEPTVPAGADFANSMIYTSGTTGHPKGASRSKATDPATVIALLTELRFQPGNEVH